MSAAAIYARVSSDRQPEEQTIASQTAALKAFAASLELEVSPDWIFEDEGYSGEPGSPGLGAPAGYRRSGLGGGGAVLLARLAGS
jgi:DNA invertase Pin-like site-specific DNA recombinase